MKPTHTKLDEFAYGTNLLTWEQIGELEKIPGVMHVGSHLVPGQGNVIEAEGTSKGLHLLRKKLGVKDGTKETEEQKLHDQLIYDTREMLKMLDSGLRNQEYLAVHQGRRLEGLILRNLRLKVMDLVIDAGHVENHGDISTGQAKSNLEYYLSHRYRYKAMSLKWVCSKNFIRH